MISDPEGPLLRVPSFAESTPEVTVALNSLHLRNRCSSDRRSGVSWNSDISSPMIRPIVATSARGPLCLIREPTAGGESGPGSRAPRTTPEVGVSARPIRSTDPAVLARTKPSPSSDRCHLSTSDAKRPIPLVPPIQQSKSPNHTVAFHNSMWERLV